MSLRKELWKVDKDLSQLDFPFTQKEIKKAIWDLAPEKASRPDGYLIFLEVSGR